MTAVNLVRSAQKVFLFVGNYSKLGGAYSCASRHIPTFLLSLVTLLNEHVTMFGKHCGVSPQFSFAFCFVVSPARLHEKV